jgi:hypothetical protein
VVSIRASPAPSLSLRAAPSPAIPQTVRGAASRTTACCR